MAVEIADNILNNIDGNERDKVNSFRDSPGYGGQRVQIKIGLEKEDIAHVTYGAGSDHVTIFYNRSGQTYQIVGVGKHTGKKAGKTTYSCLWQDNDSRRVTVTILKKKTG